MIQEKAATVKLITQSSNRLGQCTTRPDRVTVFSRDGDCPGSGVKAGWSTSNDSTGVEGSPLECGSFTLGYPVCCRCLRFLRRRPWSVSTMWDLVSWFALVTVPLSPYMFSLSVLIRTWSPGPKRQSFLAPNLMLLHHFAYSFRCSSPHLFQVGPFRF